MLTVVLSNPKNKLILYTLLIGAVFCVSCQSKTQKTTPSNPVFDLHIEPIIAENCAPCHRQNGGAPFVLTSYESVRKKAKTIAKVTQLRYMPPWPADPNYSHFIGERRLTDEQIELIQQWVNKGAKPGKNPNRILSKIPPFESALGKPDLVLFLDTLTLHQGDEDRFFLVKASASLPEKKFIRALEIIPGQPRLMHHFNGHLINYEYGSKIPFDLQPRKVEITPHRKNLFHQDLDLMTNRGITPERVHSVLNYLPGVSASMYPEGIGTFQVNREFSIVGNDLHYGPSAKTLVDQTRIHVFFTDVPPKRGIGELMLGTNGVSKIIPPLVIEPNTRSTHRTEFVVPEDISVLTVNPHLHLLGKSVTAYALKPNGDTVRLIKIPKWDFRWQYFYTFEKMIRIPRGSKIVVIAEFDNTKNNPFNPFNPPQRVAERFEYGGSSMKATDEMFQFIITYVGYQPGDENISLKTNEDHRDWKK
jgi:hypothetical protein